MRFPVVAAILASAAWCQNTDVVRSWYPLEPSDTWVYEKEALDGYMDHPDVERWTTEETVVRSVEIPELGGTLVTKTIKVLSDTLSPGYLAGNDRARREPPESHLLIYRSCVYVLDGLDGGAAACPPDAGSTCLKPLDENHQLRPQYRDDLVRGDIPADFCFPMQTGQEWGRVRDTSPAEEYVWRIDRRNGDPFGPPGMATFHFSCHIASGEFMDRWFAQGIGVVQEISAHHGTYWESRRRLLRATIGGKTRTFNLPQARLAPLFDSDCNGSGWKHYAHPDGSSFRSAAECVAFTSRPK
jgi:hypothetical protein